MGWCSREDLPGKRAEMHGEFRLQRRSRSTTEEEATPLLAPGFPAGSEFGG